MPWTDDLYGDLDFPAPPSPPPADPFDEDGYCDFCGHGRWRLHAPWCRWMDLVDGISALGIWP